MPAEPTFSMQRKPQSRSNLRAKRRSSVKARLLAEAVEKVNRLPLDEPPLVTPPEMARLLAK